MAETLRDRGSAEGRCDVAIPNRAHGAGAWEGAPPLLDAPLPRGARAPDLRRRVPQVQRQIIARGLFMELA